ncbi:MAG: glycosyltransferase family 2 protein [Candidatus Competibacteraceae bacterium]|nr:glycosyltransferase family 2 protein [Candidatus Competibacteraceae bacterium]
MNWSLVVALHNEEDNVQPLIRQIHESLSGYSYEIILVDDGSTDQTAQRILALNDPLVKLLIFSKNFGQTHALSAGIEVASGTYIITLDGDLQNDPTDIPAMVTLLEGGDWDVVAGSRKNRQDGFLLRKIPSKIANALIRKLTGVHISDYGCTLKVFKKEIAKNLNMYGELHRFIPVLAVMQGARITETNVKHHPRQAGKSKYGIGRTMKVMSDLILMLFFQKYLQKPMHLFGSVGILSFLAGGVILTYLLVEKFLGNDIWGRPLLLLGILLVIGGIQIITFGFIAEIQMRTYYESQQLKPYRIKSIYIGNQKT